MKHIFAKTVLVSVASLSALAFTVYADEDHEVSREPQWGQHLSAATCGTNLGSPLVNINEKVVRDVDSGMAGNYWAYDTYTRHIKMWQTDAPTWNVVGTYTWTVLGTYVHDITITSQDANGNFTGTGGYPSGSAPYTATGQTPETITGKVSGNTITMTTVYAGPYSPGFTVTATGTIDASGHISGTMPWTWSMTSGVAKKVGTYCAIVKYEGEAAAIAGQTGPGGSGVIGKDVEAEMKGGYVATFSGAFAPTGLWKTKGSVGLVDYKCDISGNCPGRIDWVAQYVPDYMNFQQPWWGWIYHADDHHGTWINSSDGSSGNIL